MVIILFQEFPTDGIQQDQKAFPDSYLEAINRTTRHRPGAEIHPPHAPGLIGSPMRLREKKAQSQNLLILKHIAVISPRACGGSLTRLDFPSQLELAGKGIIANEIHGNTRVCIWLLLSKETRESVVLNYITVFPSCL